jgi:pimeloyl-ACP methyl ester carboxylesterase
MFTHEYAEVNGIRLHYVTEGSGRLILFAHGFPEFWYAWKDQLSEFGRDYQVVALDMRGFNLSSKPAEVEQYQMKYLVEDVRRLVRQLGHERFTLVAHDWGGAMAWVFAVSHPEMLDGLVIINSPHPAIFARELSANPAQQQASQYMVMLRSAQSEQALAANNYAQLREKFMGDGLWNGIFSEEDRKAYLEAWAQPGALTGGVNYYRVSRVTPTPVGTQAAQEGPSRDLNSLTVRVPTLVIWGEQDQALLTGNLDGLEPFIPDLRVKRIPDGSHWVIHEHSALVNQYVREFMERQQ